MSTLSEFTARGARQDDERARSYGQSRLRGPGNRYSVEPREGFLQARREAARVA